MGVERKIMQGCPGSGVRYTTEAGGGGGGGEGINKRKIT